MTGAISLRNKEIIADAINNSVTEKIYKVEMEKRLSNNGIKEREKKQLYKLLKNYVRNKKNFLKIRGQ